MKWIAPVRLLGLVVGLAAWSTMTFAECTEGSLDYKTDTHEFKYCDESETWQSLGGGGALGDQIVSGTLAVTANSATSYVSFSTNGTTWGYLSSGASYLPTISAGKVSGTTISTTYVQLASATSVLTCNSGATGTMRYTSGTMQVCDGSDWGNIGIGVPTGTIAAFEASSCPAGWSEYTPARGRFLRGIDTLAAGIDPDGTRAAGNTQEDSFKAHKHNAPQRANGSLYTGDGTNHNWRYNIQDVGMGDVAGTSTVGGDETRPKNVAVTFCQYAGFDSELSAGVATLASLSDVSVGGAASGQALVFDGASWVPSTSAVAVSGTGAIQFSANGAGVLGGDAAALFWDNANKRLGVGTGSPGQRLDVSGTVQATAYLHASDLRLKTEIETVENPLELVGRLRGVKFTWKEGDTPAYGVIAQEVEAVMPEAVAGEGERMKAVDYDQLIGPMIEAIKELKASHKKLETANRQMQAEIESLKRQME